MKRESYRVAEVAAMLGVSIDTVEREIDEGRMVKTYIRTTPVVPAWSFERYKREVGLTCDNASAFG